MPCRYTWKLAICKFSRRLKLQDFLWFTRNSRAAGGGGGGGGLHSLISSCGRDLINELDQEGIITIQQGSIESQKGIITIQQGSIENQKGAIAVQSSWR